MTQTRVAVLTAAGRGIGAACARELAQRGHALIVMARSESADALAAETGGLALRGSVTEPADLERLVALAIERHGRIDVVVNSTGNPTWSADLDASFYDINGASHLLDIPDGDWHGMLDLLVLSAVRMARLVTPHMQRQGGGSIINISGVGAAASSPAYPLGGTLRRALTGFTKLYAARYGRDGIRMNNVLPGLMENHVWSADLLASVPAQRSGRLAEVARTVAFLAGDDSSYVTGQDVLVDGGLIR